MAGVGRFGSLVTDIEAVHFKMFKWHFAVRIRNALAGPVTREYERIV